jgi:hypothetical protein
MYDSEFLDDLTKTKIVLMILDKQTEQALQLLSNFYNTDPPNLAVGTIKGNEKLSMLYMFKENEKFMRWTQISFTIRS